MKILIVSQYFWPENFKINDLAISLKNKGYEVSVLTGKPNYPQGKFYKGYGFFSRRKEIYHGIKIRRIPLIPRGKSTGIRLAINYLSFVFSSCSYMLFHHKKYDAIFIFATSPITVAFPALVYRWFHKVKTLLWILDLWPESVSAASNMKNSTIHKLLTQMVKYIYKKVDKILISSKGFKSSIIHKNVPENKINYIPNWAEDIYESPHDIDFFKYKSLIPNGFIVMFTGNIGEAQDCESILATAENLHLHDNNDIQIVMVGDGRKRLWLESEASKKKLTNLHFLGKFPLEEMPNIIAHANVLLVSLKDEYIFTLTAPAKIQTYLASSKPIAAMINGEGANIINEAKAGFSCNAGDSDALAEGLINLSKLQQQELEAIGKKGKQYYDANFRRDKIITEIDKLLHESA